MPANTGNLDISQINTVELSGGGNAAQLVSTTLSTKTAGDVAIWDANGNLIDAGASLGSGTGSNTNSLAAITIDNVPASMDFTIFIDTPITSGITFS